MTTVPTDERSLPLRERKRLGTRRALADTALRMFTEKGFEATVDHYGSGIEKQVIACLAAKLDLDPEDLRLHVLAELTTTCWSVSARNWVGHSGQGGRKALIKRLERTYQSVPASLELSAHQ